MSAATITSKGQITIPKAVRQGLGVQPGDRVEFVDMGNGIFQMVAANRDIKTLKGIVPRPATPVSVEEMNKSIAEMGRRKSR